MGHDLPISARKPPLLREVVGTRPANAGATLPVLRGMMCDWRAFDRGDRVAAWDQLALSASEPNPFYESWFLLPALEQFDPHGRVKIFAIESDGQLVGLLPLRHEWQYYGYPIPNLRGWTHENCFLGAPLVMKGCEQLFWSELLRTLDRSAQTALFLHLAHMPAEGALHAALRRCIDRHDRPAATVMREERALLQSELSPEAYLEQSLSTKKRKELRRQERRLAENGRVEVERLTGCDDVGEWAREFVSLEAKGWKGQNGSSLSSDNRTRRVFAKALAGAARRDRLERLTLRVDGKAVAMLANFITPPGAFSFKTAFDEDYARYSPGVQLQRANLEILQDCRVDWIDSCAASDHPMIDHFWRERRKIARYSIGIGGTLRRWAFTQTVRFETGAASGGV